MVLEPEERKKVSLIAQVGSQQGVPDLIRCLPFLVVDHSTFGWGCEGEAFIEKVRG